MWSKKHYSWVQKQRQCPSHFSKEFNWTPLHKSTALKMKVSVAHFRPWYIKNYKHTWIKLTILKLGCIQALRSNPRYVGCKPTRPVEWKCRLLEDCKWVELAHRTSVVSWVSHPSILAPKNREYKQIHQDLKQRRNYKRANNLNLGPNHLQK